MFGVFDQKRVTIEGYEETIQPREPEKDEGKIILTDE
jgi:hypothetical protein